MVALLDVNVLIALFDPGHLHHEAAHGWFTRNEKRGWATCPLTENGLVRILSNPAYPGRRTTAADARDRLIRFRRRRTHRFWPDSVSLCDDSHMKADRMTGHRQITDVYLLALAAANGGRLATFDDRMPLDAATRARPENLAVIRLAASA